MAGGAGLSLTFKPTTPVLPNSHSLHGLRHSKPALFCAQAAPRRRAAFVFWQGMTYMHDIANTSCTT